MKNGNRKGVFEFPDNCIDLIDLFLSPEIRAARRQANRQIEQSNMTPMAQQVAKTFTAVHAITAQAEANQREQRAMRAQR